MRVVLISLFIIGLVACSSTGPSKQDGKSVTNENPYESTYVASKPSNSPRQPMPNGPKIYRGVDKDKDYERMEQRGFEFVGYSNFTAGNISPNLMIPQAKKVKADVVMVYTERTGEIAEGFGEMKLEQARRKNGGDKSGDELQDKSQYTYYAAYWSKLAPPVLGVHVKPSINENAPRGLIIVRVIDGSPADQIGLQEEDILQSVGDVVLGTMDTLGQATQRYSGQTVDIVYVRDGKVFKTKVKLNKRNSS